MPSDVSTASLQFTLTTRLPPKGLHASQALPTRLVWGCWEPCAIRRFSAHARLGRQLDFSFAVSFVVWISSRVNVKVQLFAAEILPANVNVQPFAAPVVPNVLSKGLRCRYQERRRRPAPRRSPQ